MIPRTTYGRHDMKLHQKLCQIKADIKLCDIYLTHKECSLDHEIIVNQEFSNQCQRGKQKVKSKQY